MSASDEVKAELAPLIEQARAEGLWLWCHYQDLWFSPDELQAQNAKGKFLWGAVNWMLRDPQERVKQAAAAAQRAANELARVRASVQQ